MPMPPLPASVFVPTEGAVITVQMPGELMRCSIARVIDDDTVIVCVDSIPMTRNHMFRKGDMIGARRIQQFGRDVWEAADDRDFVAGRSPSLPPAPKAGDATAKPKTKAKKVSVNVEVA